jgi:hypothetical protein
VGVAPYAKIMPLKVFNPWGITNSAAIYAAFTYAVDHGAHVILCGWATSVPSEALRLGVAYARDHGVPVITSAGDQGMSINYSPTYPTLFARDYENVVPVTAVDESDRILSGSNFDPILVRISAPGKKIPVADPRGGTSHLTSSDAAAAVVAGTLARNLTARGLLGNAQDWIGELLADAEVVSGLKDKVAGGLRVRVRR